MSRRNLIQMSDDEIRAFLEEERTLQAARSLAPYYFAAVFYSLDSSQHSKSKR